MHMYSEVQSPLLSWLSFITIPPKQTTDWKMEIVSFHVKASVCVCVGGRGGGLFTFKL